MLTLLLFFLLPAWASVESIDAELAHLESEIQRVYHGIDAAETARVRCAHALTHLTDREVALFHRNDLRMRFRAVMAKGRGELADELMQGLQGALPREDLSLVRRALISLMVHRSSVAPVKRLSQQWRPPAPDAAVAQALAQWMVATEAEQAQLLAAGPLGPWLKAHVCAGNPPRFLAWARLALGLRDKPSCCRLNCPDCPINYPLRMKQKGLLGRGGA